MYSRNGLHRMPHGWSVHTTWILECRVFQDVWPPWVLSGTRHTQQVQSGWGGSFPTCIYTSPFYCALHALSYVISILSLVLGCRVKCKYIYTWYIVCPDERIIKFPLFTLLKKHCRFISVQKKQKNLGSLKSDFAIVILAQ